MKISILRNNQEKHLEFNSLHIKLNNNVLFNEKKVETQSLFQSICHQKQILLNLFSQYLWKAYNLRIHYLHIISFKDRYLHLDRM